MHLRLAVSALLVAATFAVYLQVGQHRFVDVDDLTAIVANPDLRVAGPVQALGVAARSVLNANWVPLTVLSLQVSHAIHGLEPGGYLLTNAALHAAASVVLFLALARLTGSAWPSAFVAAVFALHPLHVESVAWAAMRKDSLSALFWMLTLLAYARYAERPGPGRYAPVALFLILSLLAKPVAVTLPFVLLLLDHWPLARLGGRPALRRALLEKLPLLAPVAVVCAVTILVQRDAGALTDAGRLPVPDRVWNAVDAYAVYLGKSFWPTGLAVFYPHPAPGLPGGPPASGTASQGLASAAALRGLGLAAVTALVLGLARSRPYLAVGWLWFLGTLVPMIGLVQVGLQARADRYTYLPLIGLSIAAAWGAADLLRHRRALLAAAGVGVPAALGVAAFAQVTHWKDAVALHAHAVAVTRDNQLEHHRLGNALRLEGRFQEALPHYLRAVELAGDAPAPHVGLGDVYFQLGRLEEAAASYRRGVVEDPSHARGHANLGIALLRLGRAAEARVELERALALETASSAAAEGPAPTALATAHLALADALLELGEPERAVPHYRRALAIDPGRSRARRRLGVALARSGRFAEARPLLARSLAGGAGSAPEHAAMARVMAGLGRPRDAVRHYRAALVLAPGSTETTRELAWLLATSPDASLRRPEEAVRLLLALPPEARSTPELLDTLAAAYAAAGRYDEAVRAADRALELAGDDPERSAAIRARRDLFRGGQPHLEAAR